MSVSQPSRQNIIQFTLYNVGGLVYFAVGYLLFVGLYGGLHWSWFVAKVAADLVGWSLNYLVQHYVAFRPVARSQGHRRVLQKFVPFSMLNLVLDYAIVGGLNWLGITPYVGLLVSALFFTFWKWFWYRRWVFVAANSRRQM